MQNCEYTHGKQGKDNKIIERTNIFGGGAQFFLTGFSLPCKKRVHFENEIKKDSNEIVIYLIIYSRLIYLFSRKKITEK